MMKIFKNLFLPVIVLFFVTGCSNEDNLNDNAWVQDSEVQFTEAELKVLYQMRNENNKVSIEEATQFANDVIGFLDGETAVKSGIARNISSITPMTSENIQSVALKSADGVDVEIPDTVAYVFNFGNDAGYAIISADTRIEDPILAYTGDGSLGKEIDNPGLALFLEGTENYILRSIVEAEQRRDSLINDILAKLDITDESDTKFMNINRFDYTVRTTVTATGPWTRTAQKAPLSPVEWGQGYPYNQTVPKACSNDKEYLEGKAPTGCVATATAHIMAYWQYPPSIDGKSFDWTVLNSYTTRPNAYDNVNGKNQLHTRKSYVLAAQDNFNTQVANLMERIGAHVDMDYGCEGSGASTACAARFLQKCGYKFKSTNPLYTGVLPLPINFNTNTVIASLEQNQPVLIYGYRTKNTFLGITIYYSDGHAWVVDGYISQRQEVTTKVELILKLTGKVISQSTSIGYNYSHYLHNNWGWNGDKNGYYVAGSFNANNGPYSSSNTKSGEPKNYQYDVDIFPFISR